jgi:hypothetical protein
MIAPGIWFQTISIIHKLYTKYHRNLLGETRNPSLSHWMICPVIAGAKIRRTWWAGLGNECIIT